LIDQLSNHIKKMLPASKGFSVRNLSWYHHISSLSKVKNERERIFYIIETAKNGWSRDIMLLQVKSDLYHRKGSAIANFKNTLPPAQSELATLIPRITKEMIY